MDHLRIKISLLIALTLFLVFCTPKTIDADLLITNGLVYNGMDTIPHNLGVAVKGDKIVFIGDIESVRINTQKTIDASGLIVAPGFIDPHTHADRDLVDSKNAHNLPFMMQGITTVIVGNDGSSYYPSEKYKKLYETQNIGTNAVFLVGHGTIRKEVLGESNVAANQEQIAQMQALVKAEMEAGAAGLSTGLFYAPGSYSNTAEVIALAKVVAEKDGIYDTHLRDESAYTVGLIPAIEEAIEIGRQAKLPVHISHIKCLGVDVWHQSDTIVQLIKKARKTGVEVTANQYPYNASATGLKDAVVPRWAESGGRDSMMIRYNDPRLGRKMLIETKKNIDRRGGPDKLLMVKVENDAFLNKNLLEISEELNLSPEESVYAILKSGYVRVASFNMIDEDIKTFMRQDWVVTGSDGNTGHPRKYGSFPRKYHKYVLQEKVIGLASFINRSTGKTAEIFKIEKRGKLKTGYYADIIVFNPETFRDNADYQNAFQQAEGLAYSIINGQLSVDRGKYTGKMNGKVLTKNN
ncbi:N-acyl-D-amino-acid deacylase family protein [Spongiimicrobium sp. 3-5]|uniref:N-acyl-D-amino-acid deacylase family protein n=1 Tax=Spongiimicrobium sp. 3-5 TaxID=3332596 RepID=UPI00398150A5